MSTRPRIALVGAGNIGGELAAAAARKELGDIVLFDIPEKEGLAKGKALDLEQNGAVLGYDAQIKGTASYDQVLEIARKALGNDENNHRAEFVTLSARARDRTRK